MSNSHRASWGLSNVSSALEEASSKIALRDAQLLLAALLQKDRTWLLTHDSEPLAAAVYEQLLQAVERRASGEPLQYVLGTQEFFGLPFKVEPGVLIPRPETEHLVEAVLSWASDSIQNLRIVDVGTGSGAIALALAKHLPTAEIIAVDISSRALEIARRNARALALEANVRFVQADLLSSINDESLDAVVSNPPYIALPEAASMQGEVVDHEPHVALFAGEDGLSIFRKLIPEARRVLRCGGLLALEFGFGQAEAMRELLRDWENIRVVDDYAGIPRVAIAEKR